jgi:hypothetical protein
MPRYNPLKPDQEAVKPKTDYLTKKTIPNPKPISTVPTLTENSKGGFDIRFPTKPSPEILAAFHATQQLGRDFQWHWHWKQHVWYARRNDITRAFAALIIAGTPPRPVRPPDETAADIARIEALAANPAMLADATTNSESLNENVVAVNFVAAPSPARPVAAWRTRFLRGTV